MAVTAAQKAEFLESVGQKKSLHYFMTGPNLGGDWNWSKALAGGYSQQELDGFMASANNAYAAHKAKDAATPAPNGDPGPDPAGMGQACAATAAKAIVSAASQAKIAIEQAYHHTFPLQGIKVLDGSVTSIDHATALRNELVSLHTQVVAEVGQDAPEAMALRTMIDHLHATRTMSITLDTVNAYLDGELSAVSFFEDMHSLRSLLVSKMGVDPALVTSALADVADEAGSKLLALHQGWLAELDDRFSKIVMKEFTDSSNGLLTETYFPTVADTAEIMDLGAVETLLSNFDTRLSAFSNELGWAVEEVFDTLKSTTLVNDFKKAYAALGSRANAVLKEATEVTGWLGDDVVLSSSGLLSKYETMDDFVARFNAIEQKTMQMVGKGFPVSPITFPDEVFSLAEDAFNDAVAIAKMQIPTPTPVGAPLKVTMLEDVIANAGTDDLNPMVKTVLEQQGETPSLVYFMSKGQKQDMLTLSWDEFTTTHYNVTYKGQALEGGGLTTAKAKYAMKQGVPAPKATPHAEEMASSIEDALAASTKTPPVNAAGVVPVTGEVYPLPPGSPKWYADPFTEKQANFLEALVAKDPAAGEHLTAAGFYDLAASGDLTKGQMSLLINALQNNLVSSTDQAKFYLKYGAGEYPISPMKAAAESMDAVGGTPSPIADVLNVAEPGPVVSGQKAATAVAPDNPVWDAPHSFSYMGDGQSKWGGAHRKWWFQDEEGNDWMLKHGADFRAEGELAAHKIAHAAGFDIAEARVATLRVGGSSETGIVQRMYRSSDISGELQGVLTTHGGSFAGVDDAIVSQIQQHQVLDWLIGNHDSHSQNFILLRDGRVVGVDKGQAFKFYGKDRLAHDYRPPGNHGEIAYNRMWADYRAGKIDLDLNAIDDALSNVEAMSDEMVADLVEAYSRGRFRAAGSDAFLEGTSAQSADELVQLVLERKRTIRKQFEEFYQEQAQARGVKWTPRWAEAPKAVKVAKPKVVSASEILTPIDDDFAAALNRVGTNGKAVYVAGSEVEQGQILFDLVQDTSGKRILRLNAHLRPEGDEKLMRIIRTEAGDAVMKSASAGVADGMPQAVQLANGWNGQVTAAAKTINHHIGSGDYQFNASSLSSANQILDQINADPKITQLVGEGLDNVAAAEAANPMVFRISDTEVSEIFDRARESVDPESVELYVLKQIESLAAERSRQKAMLHFRPHLLEISEQGAKGTEAAKVSIVPEFDSVSHFRMLRDDAKKRFEELRAGVVVEVEEAPRVFSAIETERIRTTQIVRGGVHANDPVAQLSGWEDVRGGEGTQWRMATEINGKKVEVVYRDVTHRHHTNKGWLEIAMQTGDTEVNAEDVAALHRWLNEKIGVSAKLANSTDMELTYWRMVQGNYKFSATTNRSSTSYAKAVSLAEQRLGQLGPAPTAEQEIEAIRGAYRQVFGAVIDEADTMPIHSHMTDASAEEMGWAFWERPELANEEVARAFQDKWLYHSLGYNSSNFTEDMISASTGQGMLSQAERLRYGVKSGAASPERDLQTGGSAGFYSRISRSELPTYGDVAVINPTRRMRRLLDYNAPRDTYGELAERDRLNELDVAQAADRASGSSGNEVMLRNIVSYMDDVEINFFDDAAMRDRWIRVLRERGVNTIRGVPIEERLVLRSGTNLTAYTKDFFRRYVDAGARLRLAADDVVGAAKSTASATKRFVLESRMRIKDGKLTKKLSAGRDVTVRLRSQGFSESLKVKYHVSENAISVPKLVVDEAILDSDAPFKVASTADATVIDLSSFGIDVKTIPAQRRSIFIQQFLGAIRDGDAALGEVITRWGGSII